MAEKNGRRRVEKVSGQKEKKNRRSYKKLLVAK